MLQNYFNLLSDLADKYASVLSQKMSKRMIEMRSDDNSHYLIYRVLGIPFKEGKQIDEYQNKGRFLYRYAGSFLEEASILCFEQAYPSTQKKIRIPNNLGNKPKTFEIDCLVSNDAYEIKWRDATTDGDHIVKEHTRIKNIKEAGYNPIRIMFYYPNRAQAIKVQEALKAIYNSVDGEYYFGDSAWEIINERTGINLLKILEKIADEKEKSKLQ